MALRSLRILLAALLLAGSLQTVKAQGGTPGIKQQNLPNFDMHRFHFGFLLSYNVADLLVGLKSTAYTEDSLLVLGHSKRPGFNLGIVSSFNMSDNFSLRFLPTLSFQERVLQYQFREANGSISTYDKPIESTYLEFPLLVKFRSDRINNFAVYLLAGGKFSIDMASQKDVNNNIDEEIVVKLDKYDYSMEFGGGIDMFLPYFKFGIEMKTGIGIPNLFIDDGTRFSNPIESLRTRTFVLTFTFEG